MDEYPLLAQKQPPIYNFGGWLTGEGVGGTGAPQAVVPLVQSMDYPGQQAQGTVVLDLPLLSAVELMWTLAVTYLLLPLFAPTHVGVRFAGRNGPPLGHAENRGLRVAGPAPDQPAQHHWHH